MNTKERFNKIASTITRWSGSIWASVLAFASVIIWAAFGPYTGFSDSWQLVANTGTTLITFLMVFLIQNNQNRDGRAIQLKLDELIYSKECADNRLINVESLSDEDLDKLHKRYLAIAEELKSREPHNHRGADNGQ